MESRFQVLIARWTVKAAFSFVFNPNDADTAEFLSSIGVAAPRVSKGEIFDAELVRDGIDPLAFLKLLEIAVIPEGPEFSTRLFENLENGFLELNETTAAYAIDFLRDHDSPLLRSLLHYGACPDGESARIVMENIYSDSAAFYAERPEGITPEGACALTDLIDTGFATEDIEGVAFNENTAGEFWNQIGQAVIPLSMWDGQGGEYAGSGVIVSPEGHVMTAAHNVIQSDGEVFPDVTFRYGGTEYLLSHDEVLYVDVAEDIAVLRLPALALIASLPYARLAEVRPEEGDDVMVIGYPLTAGADTFAGEFPEAYTPGRYFYPMSDDSTPEELIDPSVPREGIYHVTTARPFPGNSGGGFFNEKGELIGITSNVETVVNRSEAASTLLADAEDPRYEEVLRHIQDTSR